MNRARATQTIEAYFGSWMNRDLDRFLSTLSDDAVIVECDGSAYRGWGRARRWFVDWHAEPANGRVTDWKILRILFDEGNGVATVEWDFRCVCRGEASSFLGASVVIFDGTKIARVHEYRMEKPTRTSQDLGRDGEPRWRNRFAGSRASPGVRDIGIDAASDRRP